MSRKPRQGGVDGRGQATEGTSREEVAGIGVFAGLSSPALDACASLALRRSLAKGDRVFQQGDRPARFHVLLSGWIRIVQAGADGELAVVRFVGAGELFGSFAVFTGDAYPADAIAAAEAVELSWSERQLRGLVESHPKIAVNLVSIAARRLLELQERLREVSTQPIEQRIANALLRLAEPSDGGRSGKARIVLPFTRRDIASLAGTTLFSASRTMAHWKKSGLIDTLDGMTVINSVDQLRRIGDRI